jgi:release factor glutamine methyltransferase
MDMQDMPLPARKYTNLQDPCGGIPIPDGRTIRILDLCTGSGCIAWSLAAAIPQAAVCACDISPVALQIAGSQNIFNPDGTPAQARFFECDILSPQAEQTILSQCADVPAAVGAGGKLDLIVSNPPYVCDSEKLQMRPNVLEHEPHLALFVPDEDPLVFYRAIAQLSGRLLKPGGALMFEINERFGQETKKILQDLGFENCRVVQDIFGKDRMVLGYKNFS